MLLDDKGNEIQGEGEGVLCIKAPWPSMLRPVYGDQARRRGAWEGVKGCGDAKPQMRCAAAAGLHSPPSGRLRAGAHGAAAAARLQARFETTYFGAYKGYYFSSDGARRDADGYYWITGRVDDVVNVSGHRIGARTRTARG